MYIEALKIHISFTCTKFKIRVKAKFTNKIKISQIMDNKNIIDNKNIMILKQNGKLKSQKIKSFRQKYLILSTRLTLTVS